MAPPTPTDPRPHQVPFQLSAERLHFVPLLLPRLFGLANSWRYTYQTTPLLIPSMHLSPVLTHLAYEISDHPSCGCSPVSFPVLCGQYAYPTCLSSLAWHEHFCQATPDFEPTEEPPTSPPPAQPPLPPSHASHSASVQVDPDSILPVTVRAKFQSLLKEYDSVFDPQFPGYNGSAGPNQAKVNIGPIEPPQRKGRLPQYARDKLIELKEKFDHLEQLGVFQRPEDVGITVEYLNLSFLVKKPNCGFRLVTAFADVGRYSKPQPPLLPDVDSTLRRIAQWSHVIVTDLTSAFYQIPLAKESMKYSGVATPFKGVCVYVRSTMDMPGSETALKEVMCRVLGPLLQDGFMAKIAHDLYYGGNTPHDLLHNWQKVLHILHQCNLRLSAHKTIICPRTTTILGWIWNAGSWVAITRLTAFPTLYFTLRWRMYRSMLLTTPLICSANLSLTRVNLLNSFLLLAIALRSRRFRIACTSCLLVFGS